MRVRVRLIYPMDTRVLVKNRKQPLDPIYSIGWLGLRRLAAKPAPRVY